MSQHFRNQDSQGYDERVPIIIPAYQTLHDISAAHLAVILPDKARILIVGAGTGAEILALHKLNPSWHYTAVEPLPAMLEQAEQKLKHVNNVNYHLGYLADLPEHKQQYDAALCHLVLHFIADKADKLALLQQIAARLKSDAPLLHSDSIKSEPDELPMLVRYALAQTMSPQVEERIHTRFSQDIHRLSIDEFAELAQQAGFTAPKLYFRNLAVAGWQLQRV